MLNKENPTEQEEHIHLNDTTINVSYGHVIGNGETLKVLDETTLQVTAVTCLHCCIYQALATSPASAAHSSSHLISLTTSKSHVQFHILYAGSTSFIPTNIAPPQLWMWPWRKPIAEPNGICVLFGFIVMCNLSHARMNVNDAQIPFGSGMGFNTWSDLNK